MIAWSTISWAWINNIFHVRKPSRIDQDTKWRLSLPLNMLASFSFQSWLFEQQSQTIPYFCWPTPYPSLYISSPSSASHSTTSYSTLQCHPQQCPPSLSSSVWYWSLSPSSYRACLLQEISPTLCMVISLIINSLERAYWFWHRNWYNKAFYKSQLGELLFMKHLNNMHAHFLHPHTWHPYDYCCLCKNRL